MILYYIGPGKKETGDWCFSDGFISFREIMDVYIQHFKGHVLTIISDCSYSGSWVREAMVFLDEKGVGPCGHMAKEKRILLKVYASCQAKETPAEMVFSTHSIESAGEITLYDGDLFCDKIYSAQHPSGLDFTELRCSNSINLPCTMLSGAIWQKYAGNSKQNFSDCS